MISDIRRGWNLFDNSVAKRREYSHESTLVRCETRATSISRLHSEFVECCSRAKDSQGRTFLACNGLMKSASRLRCLVQGRARVDDVGESIVESVAGDESRLISVIEFRTRDICTLYVAMSVFVNFTLRYSAHN